MKQEWLTEEVWKLVQDSVPIVCVDVLPVMLDSSGALRSIGLIRRMTPHEGLRWMLLGGRVKRGESLSQAIDREVSAALGSDVRTAPHHAGAPHHVAEYFPTSHAGRLHDPRKHAVGLTYVIPIEGPVRPRGEAVEFSWFQRASLPTADEIGFGQRSVIDDALSAYETRSI